MPFALACRALLSSALAIMLLPPLAPALHPQSKRALSVTAKLSSGMLLYQQEPSPHDLFFQACSAHHLSLTPLDGL